MKFVPRSEATYNFIIETTAELFNKHGYAGTSIADVEAATKLTKGSIYGNFENKEQLALAVFDYNLKKIREKLSLELDKQTTFKGRVLSYLKVYGTLGTTGGCPLQNTGVEADDTHEGLRVMAAEGMVRWRNKMVDLLNQGIENKEFKADIDVEKVALTYFAIIEGGILISKTTRNIDYLSTIIDSARLYIEQICV